MRFIPIVYLGYFLFVLISLAPICQSAGDKNAETVVTLPTCCPLDLSGYGKCATKPNTEKSYLWTMPAHLISTKSATRFRLEQKLSECHNMGSSIEFILEQRSGNGTGSSSSDYFLPNGYLKIKNEYFPPVEYCINGKNENLTTTNLVIKVCKPSCGKRTPCIKKCCPLPQLYSMGLVNGTKRGCTDHGPHSPYKTTLYHTYDTKLSDIESQNVFPHYYNHSPKYFPNCKPILTPYGEGVAASLKLIGLQLMSKNYKLTKDGHILYRRSKQGRCEKLYLADANICVDGVINWNENASFYRNDEEETMYFSCADHNPENEEADSMSERTSSIYGYLLLLTSVFAALTVTVYILLWKRQNFRGWIIVSQATSLFFTNVFLAIGHIIKSSLYRNEVIDTPGCIFVAYATHFFFMSMFCWISVTGFDLWFTFRELKPTSSQSEGRRRLILYSCFAWGVPTIFVMVGGILQNMADKTNCGDTDMDSRLVIPGYGMEQCYLSEKAFGVYLYYPATIMVAVNIIFFCITIFKFYKYRKSTRMATKDESLKQFYMLSIKLFVVMGVTWVFEIISFFHTGGQWWHLFIFDIMNCLRPVFFFVIFVCKPDIIAALRDNYSLLNPILQPCSKAFPKKTNRSNSENVTMSTGLSTKRNASVN